jgi:hypothetical protein
VATSFTREEFYELVWTKPMTHLAKQFAISDVALHKMCRKQNIPTPPLGWWAKKAAGKKVTQTPLPKLSDAASGKITIAGADLSGEPPSLAEAREQARIIASTSDSEDPAKPHRIVEHTLGQLRKAKADEKGLVAVGPLGVITCEVSQQSIDRLAALLPKIVQAAARQGFELQSGQKAVVFQRDGETVGFSITEQVKREKHVLTDAEQAKLDAWQRKRDRQIANRSWDWSFDRPAFPEWDYRPTGQLTFEFEQSYFWGLSPRRSFRDAKVQRLDNMEDDIAVGLAVFAAAKVEDRAKRDAEARRVEDEQRRREEAARAKHIEDRRSAGLAAILGELDELSRLRNLTTALLEHASGDASPRVATFLHWAQEHLVRREALLSTDGLERRFSELQLFGDTDDHDFRPSRWGY